MYSYGKIPQHVQQEIPDHPAMVAHSFWSNSLQYDPTTYMHLAVKAGCFYFQTLLGCLFISKYMKQDWR
jgi:hypothetical protein